MVWPHSVGVGVLLAVLAAPAHAFFHKGCPDDEDLKEGIVYTDPARVGAFDVMYRQLDGPLVGRVTINSPFEGRQTVSYAGLFTYRSWADGVLRQWEEPQTDLAPLLTWTPGTELPFETIRYGIRSGEVVEWRTVGVYSVSAADDFRLGTCTYEAVRVTREGTLTRPDGSVHDDRQSFTYVPALMLRVEGTFVYYGAVSDVRHRSRFDGSDWPFSEDAADILNQPVPE